MSLSALKPGGPHVHVRAHADCRHGLIIRLAFKAGQAGLTLKAVGCFVSLCDCDAMVQYRTCAVSPRAILQQMRAVPWKRRTHLKTAFVCVLFVAEQNEDINLWS